MPVRVLADLHHGDLFESLRLLFEKRCGFHLYRPIGLEWYREGYWKVWDAEATAVQYLGLQLTNEWESLREHWLNNGNSPAGEGMYTIPDPHYPGVSYRGITLEAAKQTSWDIIISTMPQHYAPYEQFRRTYCPGAKHIFQMGNHWPIPDGCKNLLNSTACPTPQVPNAVQYHQEFDTTIFKPGPCENVRSIANLMHYQVHHCLPQWHELGRTMPDWTLNNYGAGNDLGSVQAGHIPDTIRRHGFIFHMKRGGEGYGYNIHHSFASGRPLVIRSQLYKETVSEPLFIHGKTCVDLDQSDMQGARNELLRMADNHEQVSADVHAQFLKVCDFTAEFEQIKAFLGRLQ